MSLVRGVVDPASGSGTERGGAWLLTVLLRPWREAGGPPVDGQLVLWWPAPDEPTYRARRAALTRGACVEAEVATPDVLPVLGRARHPAERVLVALRAVDDPELAAFAAASAPPAEVVDAVLGAFTFDPRLRCYTARLPRLRLSVEPERENDPAPSLVRAREVVAFTLAAEPDLRAAIGARLFATWSDSWRAEDEPLTEAQFRAALPLEAVTWDAHRGVTDFTAWFGEGGLFGGHGVEVVVRGGRVASVDLA